MIQAHGSDIYRSTAKKVGSNSHLEELIAQFKLVHSKTNHPMVTAKHLNLNLAIFSVDLSYAKHSESEIARVFINPEIKATKAPLVSGLEDDLSIPRLIVSIERPKQIEVSFLDEQLNEKTAVFSDLAARWIQHGIDQLNGVSIVDRLNTHRKRSVKGHLKRVIERKIETNYKLDYAD